MARELSNPLEECLIELRGCEILLVNPQANRFRKSQD